MSRIELDPQSMRVGARFAGEVGSALAEAGSRVSALPIPEGTPPGVAGDLRAAGAALARAGRSAAAQRSFLLFRARLAQLADGPLSPLVDLLCPPLLTPLDNPFAGAKGGGRAPIHHNPWGPDFMVAGGEHVIGFGRGLGEGAANTVYGLLKLTVVVGSTVVDYDLKPSWTREYAEGLKWAAKHPGEFLAAAWNQVSNADQWKKGNYGYAAGRNVVDIASLFIGVGEIAAAGKAARAATTAARLGRAESDAMRAAGTASGKLKAKQIASNPPPRRGENLFDFLDRRAASKADVARAKTEVNAAAAELDEAVKAADAARAKVDARLDQIKEGVNKNRQPEELGKSIVGSGVDGMRDAVAAGDPDAKDDR